MNTLQYNKIREALMKLHNEDPKQTDNQAEESLYATRMVEQLKKYYPQANQLLEISALAHHLKRWEIARSIYPMDKQGYFQWRRHVAKHQLAILTEVLDKEGIANEEQETIISVLKKENIKKLEESQVIEDVACMVFVQHYLEPFAAPHDKQKVVDIVRKTMLKMSQHAINETAQLPLSENVKRYVIQAVELLPNNQ